jgi:4-amino-4-deoxy-L-arabinose transferase-like glycosyltransferase
VSERLPPPDQPPSRFGRARLLALLERDALVLGAILVLAAILRFAGLPGRGDFDGDQGHDMLTLLRLIRDGQIPLLGPPTSIGDFHHGAAYYYLLAPAAWLSGVDPGAVIAWIATLGVAAVGATWWFVRSIGGRVAAAIAGLLLAVSPAAIEESTFLWNPNPIPLFAALALGCTWRGHATGRRRWTVAGVAAAGMVMQLHVLGVVFLPMILALPVSDAIRAWRGGDARGIRGLLAGVGAGLGLIALLFVPLVIHEFGGDFGETRRALAYFAGGGSGDAAGGVGLVGRLPVTFLRVVGWPLIGLVTSAPAATITAVSAAAVMGAWYVRGARGPERTAARWLGGSVIWGAVALTALAPSLQYVVAGLPNDHYHAFLDPVVIALVALTVRAIAGHSGPGLRAEMAARALATGAIVALVVVNAGRWPPFVHPNGGWPAARAAGVRIVAASPGAAFDVRGLPVFKTAEGIGYPIVAAGGNAVIATDIAESGRPVEPGRLVVIACDRIFEAVIGAACGGPAEARYLDRLPGVRTGPPLRLLDRFDASPRTSVSVYGP